MVFATLLALFFGALAGGSLHSAAQEYRWRNATVVRGVLVKAASQYHYEYRPPNQPAVIGQPLGDQSYAKSDGVVDDWARLDYDPNLPERLRRHFSRGRASTNYRQFLVTLGAGTVFEIAVLLCIVAFLRAWHDERQSAA
jgi:hypothetical protein